jgi:N-acyl-D-amino-acid deacylase
MTPPTRLVLCLLLAACGRPPIRHFDVLIRGGTVYDGTGTPGVQRDVAISGDSVVSVGDHARDTATTVIDATGLAVAPGFINTLSHATGTLLIDPRSQSDIRQGVTLEVFGESSMGPLNPAMRQELREQSSEIAKYATWSTLGEYFAVLESRGIAPNVASFVGAGTVRRHVLGENDVDPTPAQLAAMEALVAGAMREGAIGLTTTLIYTPETFASTEELVALARVAARFGGVYSAHMRSEGNRFLEAIDETLRIAREAVLPVHIYHLKAAGEANWPKLSAAIAKIDSARATGVPITADMYPYTAGATGLDAAMPPWVQEGGTAAWARRLQDPAVRARVAREMVTPSTEWESLYQAAGSADRLLLLSFRQDSLRHLIGKTLGEVARERGQSPEETAMDLVARDGSRVGVAYELMSEDNVRRQVALPWVMFGSDGGSPSAEGDFLKGAPHPRAYGNFARLLGKYVREEQLIPLEEAIRKITSLPASTLGFARRGQLAAGFHADVAIFDPATTIDKATFPNPHQYALGMRHVLVNGVLVLQDGEPTGATPGRIIRGRGWQPNAR